MKLCTITAATLPSHDTKNRNPGFILGTRKRFTWRTVVEPARRGGPTNPMNVGYRTWGGTPGWENDHLENNGVFPPTVVLTEPNKGQEGHLVAFKPEGVYKRWTTLDHSNSPHVRLLAGGGRLLTAGVDGWGGAGGIGTWREELWHLERGAVARWVTVGRGAGWRWAIATSTTVIAFTDGQLIESLGQCIYPEVNAAVRQLLTDREKAGKPLKSQYALEQALEAGDYFASQPKTPPRPPAEPEPPHKKTVVMVEMS